MALQRVFALSAYPAEKEEVLITRHGRPAACSLALSRRIESARQSLREGRGVRLEDLSTRPKRSLQRVAKKRPR
ncbi:MAG: hypothetical protein HY313_09540 [Acidobacteria bacterium]|nr:hypothetical protein [Acidobacteriota bacterium]